MKYHCKESTRKTICFISETSSHPVWHVLQFAHKIALPSSRVYTLDLQILVLSWEVVEHLQGLPVGLRAIGVQFGGRGPALLLV